MTEQEACTELVEQASQEQSSGTIEGESLLLPLLQGLLDAPENEQTPDSGTESGEDQRNGLIVEVQNALDKLSNSLRNDTTDITPERRSSLLQLVTKLQAGLSSTTTSDRRASGPTRFNRRRDRANRHTVGVSIEELADARKLIEEISFHEIAPLKPLPKPSLLQKQNSESCLGQNIEKLKPLNLIQNKQVKNATAKPFTPSNSASRSISTSSSTVETPSEPTDSIAFLFNDESSNNAPNMCDTVEDVLRNNIYSPLIEAMELPHHDYEPPINVSKNPNLFDSVSNGQETRKPGGVQDSETDEDTSTIKAMTDVFPMQNNPLYSIPKESYEEKCNRFTNKKLKMKRANTIDIPKPLNFYECDDEEDTDYDDEDNKRRRSNYLALRGPIRVGNAVNKTVVPVLEPKTESDKKFLAFISKHNDHNSKGSLWSNPTNKATVWSNKFDHMKTNFEKQPVTSQNTARNFWKSNDDSVRFTSNQYGPKISKHSARNLKQMFEEKQKQNEQSNIVTGSLKVNTKLEPEKKYRYVPQPSQVNSFSHAPSSAFQPITKNIDNFSRVHQNRFRPPPIEFGDLSKTEVKKNEPGTPTTPLYLYSPKPFDKSSSTSPNTPKPWVAATGESRVLSLAATKFENTQHQPLPSFKPRKLSQDKINVIVNTDKQLEKLTAPYLAKTLNQKSNIVRRLSGQFDNIGSKDENNVKYTSHFQKIPERKGGLEGFQAKFTVPQNYSIQYTQPKLNHPSKLKEFHVTDQYQPYSQPKTYTPQKNVYIQEQFKYKPDIVQASQISKPLVRTSQPQRKSDYMPTETYQVNKRERATPSPQYESKTNLTSEIYFPTKDVVTNDVNIATPPIYQSQSSVDSLKEYNAINSKVMYAPVAQSASTVRQKSPMTRNEHDMDAVFNLKSVLQRVSNSPSPNTQQQNDLSKVGANMEHTLGAKGKFTLGATDPLTVLVPKDTLDAKKYTSDVIVPRQYTTKANSVKPLKHECLEITDTGESIITSKFRIPVINVPKSPENFGPTQGTGLTKSDSWHQICLQSQASPNKPSPRASPNARTVQKSKSTHSLSQPKQYEAGMSKDEMAEKRKTMEAFFAGGTKSPQPVPKTSQLDNYSNNESKVVKRSINRIKTSEKVSCCRPTAGLSRSRTLPDVVCTELLDESNVDKAFEDLFKSAS